MRQVRKTLYLLMRGFKHNTGSYSGVYQEIAKYASKNNYNVKILCGRLEGQTKTEKQKYAEIIRFELLPFRIPMLGMNVDYMIIGFHVKNYLRKNKPKEGDIFLANGRAALGLIGRDYVVRIGQPAMTFLSNMEIANDYVSLITRIARFIHFNFQKILEKKSVENAKGIVTPSLVTKNIVTNAYGNKKSPYFVPQSGVNIKNFELGKKKKTYGITMLFIDSGGEYIRKGVYSLEKALPSIFEEFSNFKLLHVGKNEREWDVPAKFKKRIISLGKIEFEKMKNIYVSADFIVSCALNEGIPNTILEAMASGLPVLSSDIQGIEEYITHKKEGYIYKRGDIEELKKGIRYMIKNSKELKKRKIIKKRVLKLDYTNYCKELIPFIEEVPKSKNINLLK